MTEHPLTDELCAQIVSSTPPLPRDQQDRVLSYDGRILDGMIEECFEEQKHEMRAAYDLAIAHFSKWIYENGAEYFIQPHEHNIKTDLDTIVADFRKSMRPQEDNFS